MAESGILRHHPEERVPNPSSPPLSFPCSLRGGGRLAPGGTPGTPTAPPPPLRFSWCSGRATSFGPASTATLSPARDEPSRTHRPISGLKNIRFFELIFGFSYKPLNVTGISASCGLSLVTFFFSEPHRRKFHRRRAAQTAPSQK